MTEKPRYPGYDVMAKRDTPSWDAITRTVVDRRLATPTEPRFFTPTEFRTADALCRRIIPQPAGRAQVPLAALLDSKLLANSGDGFRVGDMPYMREAWRRGLAALDTEALVWPAASAFASQEDEMQDAVLRGIERGVVRSSAWADLDPKAFFSQRVLVDVPGLYYGHPIAWSEIGFGGPASPRGYVRLDGNPRDPWEAAEAKPGSETRALEDNRHVV